MSVGESTSASTSASPTGAGPRPGREAARGGAGVLDWVLLALAACAVGALVALRLLVVGSFVQMYRDFGSPESLPVVTRVVVTPWATIVATLVVAVLSLVGVGVRAATGARIGTAMSIVAVVVGVASIAAVVWGLYAPIFELAGRIR